jgi:hypothetical protein
MNCAEAEKAIKSVFSAYRAQQSSSVTAIAGSSHGKVYELWVLAQLLQELRQRHYNITYSHPGQPIAFKAAPGLLKQADPHFDIQDRYGKMERFQIFMNIEFTTMGERSIDRLSSKDLSIYHEIDIGIFTENQSGRPPFEAVALAIECKAVATITKAIIRGVLGLRRELSLFTNSRPTTLKGGKSVPANPPSELRLVTTDKRVSNYAASPATFGIDCMEMTP